MSKVERTDLRERLNEFYLQQGNKIQDAELRVELFKVCLRGIRHELGIIDAERFKGLIKIIDDVITK